MVRKQSSAAKKLSSTRDSAARRLKAAPLSELRLSRAVLSGPDGQQCRCRLEQINEQGAYLLRSTRRPPYSALQPGDHVALHLLPANGRGNHSIILDGTVIRVEEHGPGIAVRFGPSPQDVEGPYNDLSSDDWMTEIPEESTSHLLSLDQRYEAIDFDFFESAGSAANTTPHRTGMSAIITPAKLLRAAAVATLLSAALGGTALLGLWAASIF